MCDCRVCRENREFYAIRRKIRDPKTRAWVEDLYDKYLDQSDNLDHARVQIEEMLKAINKAGYSIAFNVIDRSGNRQGMKLIRKEEHDHWVQPSLINGEPFSKSIK